MLQNILGDLILRFKFLQTYNSWQNYWITIVNSCNVVVKMYDTNNM